MRGHRERVDHHRFRPLRPGRARGWNEQHTAGHRSSIPRGGSRAEREGFEPSDPVSQVNSLAVSPIRPLSHLSMPSQARFSAFLVRHICVLPRSSAVEQTSGEHAGEGTAGSLRRWQHDGEGTGPLASACHGRRQAARADVPRHRGRRAVRRSRIGMRNRNRRRPTP